MEVHAPGSSEPLVPLAGQPDYWRWMHLIRKGEVPDAAHRVADAVAERLLG